MKQPSKDTLMQWAYDFFAIFGFFQFLRVLNDLLPHR
jgi:hypothetical protein